MLLKLVNQVLDFSKAEAGEDRLHPETFDLGEVLRRRRRHGRAAGRENGNRLTCEIACRGAARSIPTSRCFRQSLLNLVANACKFTRMERCR